MKTSARSYIPVGALALVAGLSVVLAEAGQSPTPSPKPTANATSAVDVGKELFAKNCKGCHGDQGVGNRAPALRGDHFSADYVRKTVENGKPGTLMPKFAPRLNNAEILSLARYVASLQQHKLVDATLKGDSEAGRNVFFSRDVVDSCHVCHTFNGQGGRVGPNLTSRLATRSARDIFDRIVVVPHRSADPAYVRVRVTTTTGKNYVGIRTDGTEQDFQFYDTASLPPVLRSIPKAQLRSVVKVDGTAMPTDYASRLSLKQLLDLVAFLKSANGADSPVTLADVVQAGRPGA